MKISKVIRCQFEADFVDDFLTFINSLDDQVVALDDAEREQDDSETDEDYPTLVACCGDTLDFYTIREQMRELSSQMLDLYNQIS